MIDYMSFNNQNNQRFRANNQRANKFRDTKNHDFDNEEINDIETKRMLINYISNTINLSNYKYKLLEYEQDLQLLKEKKHIIAPNYAGTNGLLVFIKIQEKYLSFIVDRRPLTYKLAHIDMGKVRLTPVNCRLDESIYKGTIIDGVLLFNDNNKTKKFIINDVYHFKGSDMTKTRIVNKILNISTYLDTVMTKDSNMNNITLTVNKLCDMSNIEQVLSESIPNKGILGLSFYPEYSGMKLIYLFNNDCEPQTTTYDSTPNSTLPTQTFPTQPLPTQIFPKQTKPRPTFHNTNLTTFKIKQTESVDVYYLYLGAIEEQLFTYKKIGIAYIPTMTCSAFCRKLFQESHSSHILVDCEYCVEKDGWIPIKANTYKRRPDLITQRKQQ